MKGRTVSQEEKDIIKRHCIDNPHSSNMTKNINRCKEEIKLLYNIDRSDPTIRDIYYKLKRGIERKIGSDTIVQDKNEWIGATLYKSLKDSPTSKLNLIKSIIENILEERNKS